MSDQKTNRSPSFFSRLMIILFGLGLVIIGLQPIQRRYGSVTKFIQEESKAFATDFSFPRRRDRIDLPQSQTLRLGEKRSENSKIGKNHDRLTGQDRKDLNELLNSL